MRQSGLDWSEQRLRTGIPPLLKWPGGKRDIVKHIRPYLPVRFRRYYEPFFGGGALYFSLLPTNAVLSDKNRSLINCYRQVQENSEQVISYLAKMPNSEVDYYKIRATTPRIPAKQAARFIYLASLAFNGIYRENLKGVFNVPYGGKTHLDPCDIDRIKAASAALRHARILCDDFEKAVADAGPEDLVYLDPPYTVAHSDNGFVKYNSSIFSWDDQRRLARVAAELSARGCRVVVSNADHPSVRDLYPGFQYVVIERASRISASAQYRGRVTESVIHNGR